MSSILRIETAVPCRFLRGWKRRLVSLGTRALAGEGAESWDIHIIAVDDTTIADLNVRYLSHTGPTDVITFPLSEPDATLIEGEIYISRDTTRTQAQSYGVAPAEEFARLMVHGLLHLCGYADTTDAARRAMKRKENRYLGDAGMALGR